jgi:hypothetical protein
MADVNFVKSIYTSGIVTSLGELAAADQAVIPGTAKIGSLAGFLFGTAGVVSALTAPSRMVVGAASRDTATASGNQDVTGLPFTPGAVIVFANVPSVSQNMSIGFFDVTNNLVVFDIGLSVTAGWYSLTSFSIYLKQSSGDVDWNTGTCTILSDGFRIAWVKHGNPSGTANIYYLALR